MMAERGRMPRSAQVLGVLGHAGEHLVGDGGEEPRVAAAEHPATPEAASASGG